MNDGQIGRWSVLTLTSALALAACGGDQVAAQQKQQAAAARQAHVPEVSVVTVQAQDVLLEYDLPGRLQAVRSAMVMPQVSGIVQRRLFEEGSFVRAGQPLYQLQDDAYVAALSSARANLAAAQAQAAKANADLERYRPLVQAGAISPQEFDAAMLAKRAGDAAVQAAHAALRSAQVNVKRARIVAPISGFIGQSQVSEGALVTAGATPLVLIEQTDPMYVNITMAANEMMRLRQQLASQERKLNERIEVAIVLENGQEYAHKGRLLFVSPTVNENTGQITVRVEVPNPELVLMSGLYVRVKLPLAGVSNAFLVPQQAVTRGDKDTVMIVTPNGEMQPRPVSITGQKGNDWVISSGLQTGDKVVVDGIMIAGMSGAKTVKTKEWTAPTGSLNTQPIAASGVANMSASQPVANASVQAASGVQAASAASKSQ